MWRASEAEPQFHKPFSIAVGTHPWGRGEHRSRGCRKAEPALASPPLRAPWGSLLASPLIACNPGALPSSSPSHTSRLSHTRGQTHRRTHLKAFHAREEGLTGFLRPPRADAGGGAVLPTSAPTRRQAGHGAGPARSFLPWQGWGPKAQMPSLIRPGHAAPGKPRTQPLPELPRRIPNCGCCRNSLTRRGR